MIASTNTAQSPANKATLISSKLSVNQCLDQEILAATSTQELPPQGPGRVSAAHLPPALPLVRLEMLTPGTVQLPRGWRQLSVLMRRVSPKQQGDVRILSADPAVGERVKAVSVPRGQGDLCNLCINAKDMSGLEMLQSPLRRSSYWGEGSALHLWVCPLCQARNHCMFCGEGPLRSSP